jgi:hypothetical protein
MWHYCFAFPGAAKFLLNWLTTDANITTRSESPSWRGSWLSASSDKLARCDNLDRVLHHLAPAVVNSGDAGAGGKGEPPCRYHNLRVCSKAMFSMASANTLAQLDPSAIEKSLKN